MTDIEHFGSVLTSAAAATSNANSQLGCESAAMSQPFIQIKSASIQTDASQDNHNNSPSATYPATAKAEKKKVNQGKSGKKSSTKGKRISNRGAPEKKCKSRNSASKQKSKVTSAGPAMKRLNKRISKAKSTQAVE